MWLLCVGTDFRDLTHINLVLGPGGSAQPHITWQRHRITHKVPEDEAAATVVSKYAAQMGQLLGQV